MATQPRTIETPSCHRSGYNGTGATIGRYLILKDDGTNVDGVAVASAATDSLVGVSIETHLDKKTVSYQSSGKAAVYSGGAVSLGDLVTSDSAGKAVTASLSASSSTKILGRAVTPSSGADELIEVELWSPTTAFIGYSTVADKTALKAIAAANRFEGQVILVQADNSLWRFNTASSATEDTADELVQQPAAGTGRWIRADKAFIMKIPISYANTDGQAIETIPTGFCLRLTGQPYWEVTADFTGGSSSAIGLSTNVTGYEVKGDLLGGAAGDVAATLVAGTTPGTIGDEMGDQVGFHALLLEAAVEIQFDRITSAFTAGTGFACIPVAVSLTA